MATWAIDTPQQLTLDGGLTHLRIWLARATLRVVGTDGPARIEVSQVGRRGVIVSLDDGQLVIRHEVPQGGWRAALGPFWWFGVGRRHFHAHVTVAVPVETIGSVTVVAGSVVLSGLRSDSSVEVTSGSITLMGLGGTVRATTVSGSIEAVGIGGDLVAETVSGEITLAESSADRVVARTISGSVTCDLGNPYAQEVALSTTSGEITVRVPANANLDVNLHTTSGRVTSAFSQVGPGGRPGIRAAHGRLGTGVGTLQAFAVSGAVSLLSRPSEPFPSERDGGQPAATNGSAA